MTMPDTDSQSAMVAAEQVRAAIENFAFDHEEKQPGGKLTISGGVATAPADGTSVLEVTSNADQALYESKRAGRNRVTRYRGVSIGEVQDPDPLDHPSIPLTSIGKER
jgi:diguanylate cyclase (GGDEF)-like protein